MRKDSREPSALSGKRKAFWLKAYSLQLTAVFLIAYSLPLIAVFTGCASPQAPRGPILATVPLGRMAWVDAFPVLYLSGSPYEIGYQHGSMLRPRVRESVANASAFIRREVKIPLVGGWMARRKLQQAWRQLAPFVPRDYLEEMEGLSDGAGIPLATLQQIHALPELMATTCASFAAFGKATADGRLIQIRNLDWAIQSGVQRYAAIFVVRPAGKRAFVSLGWLGFAGVITGMNEEGISVAEIGSETVDASMEGVPMPFLLRRVLDTAEDLEKAAEIIRDSPRTGGYNYLFADAKAKRAVALETTRSRFALHAIDAEPSNPFGLRVANAIFRSDWALDPSVRELQLASRGNPKTPGLESPWGSSAYEVRYRGQGLLLERFHGQVDEEIAMAIARAIAPETNIQSVVYAYPRLWVANAKGKRPAASVKYVGLDLEELLGQAR